METNNNKLFTKKELFALGLTAAQVSSLTPVDSVKTGKRGRPAALYSQEQVDSVKAAPVDAGTVTPETDPEPTTPAAAETAVDAAEVLLADSELTDADLAVAA